jgi:hypothetical protein
VNEKTGSLLLNVRKKVKKAGGTIGKIIGQDKRARGRAVLVSRSEPAG